MDILKGKKTYIAAAGLFIFGVYGYFTGELSVATSIQDILAALAVFGLRRAIAHK